MIAAILPGNLSFAVVAAAGLVLGLVLLARGFAGYRAAGRVTGIASSRISSLAVGEVLVSGVVEPIELILISLLQSQPCVYYRARITQSGRDDTRDVVSEDRAVGFRVRDASGTVRVFPRGARFDVPDCYDESASTWSSGPVGLLLRDGPAFGPAVGDRDAQIAALLTVHPPARESSQLAGSWAASTIGAIPLGSADHQRRYREARIEPGATVTIVGRVLPFADVDDPAAANILDGGGPSLDDPEIAADIAAARAEGTLAATPEEAWGNAAIEGFGIGRPVRAPDLDPAADPPPPPDPTIAARAAAAFDIGPEDLILATSPDVPLTISLGPPAVVAARGQSQFLAGLLGAALAVGSAMALALLLDGTGP